MKKVKFLITGMTCAACQANVTKTVSKINGVKTVDVNLLTGVMNTEFDESIISQQDIINAVVSIGYGASLNAGKSKAVFKSSSEDKETASMKSRLIYSIILLIPLMYIAMGEMAGLPVPSFLSGVDNSLTSAFTQLLLSAPVLIINKKFFITGFKALFKKAPNMDSLVAIGSGASYIYGIFAI